MEDNLNCLANLKMTSIPKIFFFVKWKMISNSQQNRKNLKFKDNGRQPQFWDKETQRHTDSSV
jgi:hypothetical protein